MKTQLKKAALTCVMDNNSFPYTYTMLNSLLINNTYIYNNDEYDIIIILNDNILNEYYNKLINLSNNVKFYDPKKLLDGDKMAINWDKRYETGVYQYLFNRFCIFEFIKNYHNVLYLDGDLIINDNISELFEDDNFDIGACLTLYEKYGYSLPEILHSNAKCVINKTINAGVLLLKHSIYDKKYNINYLLEFFYHSLTLPNEYFENCGEDDYNYGGLKDEDFMNFFIKTHIKKNLKFKLLNQKYNMFSWMFNYNFNKTNDAKIIHYTWIKPWELHNADANLLYGYYQTLSYKTINSQNEK